MSKISIIIPVFNVEKYIGKCVDSVLKQTYANLDVILVNDGSTDSSSLICDEFAKQDSRVKVIHKQNGGLSDARNVGLDKATGDYIFYLDGDDYIISNCISLLYDAAQKYNAEVVQSNFYYSYPNYLLYNNSLKGKDKVFNREDAMHALLEQKIIKNFAWGKLISTDIAKKHPFKKGKYYEDTFWKFYIIHLCTTYVVLAKPMVYYLQRTESISGQFSIRNLDQLEGESVRLIFLKTNYPNFMDKGLKEFKKKLIKHTVLLKKLSKDEQIDYSLKIQNYKKKYGIKFKKPYFKLNNLIEHIINRIVYSKHWVKIGHDEDESIKS